MRSDDTLKKGKNTIKMLLLNILQDGDYYGYQLTQLIGEYSNGKLNIPEGSLYPALYALQDEGYITAEKKLVGKRMERIYYHLETSGKEYYNQLLDDYRKLNSMIDEILMHTPKLNIE